MALVGRLRKSNALSALGTLVRKQEKLIGADDGHVDN